MAQERKSIPEYVQLHTHSKYSVLDRIAATASPEQIVSTMKQKGYSHASLTDYENFFGLGRFMAAAEKEQMKPIPGIELPVDPGFGHTPEAVTFLPQTTAGLKDLFTLTSKVKRDGALLTLDDLANQSESSIIITRGNYLPFRELLQEADTIFFGIDSPKFPSQDYAHEAEKATGKTVVFHEARMARPDEVRVMRFLLKLMEADNVTFQTNSLLNFTIKSPIEIESLYKRHPQALGRLKEITESINVTLPKPKPVKAQDIPHPFSTEQYLHFLVSEEMERKDLPPSLRGRVAQEMKTIEEKEFSDYLLVVRDIADFARKENIPNTVYGSGNNSMVLSLLGVSSVTASDLDATRFINPDRDDLPDVDFDFPYDRRQEVENYVMNKYGDATLLSVVNHLKRDGILQVARRNAIRLMRDDVDDIAKAKIPWTVSKHPSGVTFFENAPQISVRSNELAMIDKTDVDKIYGIAKIDLLGKSALTRINRVQEMLRERGLATEIQEDDTETLEKIFSGDTLGIVNIDSPHIQTILRRIGRMKEHPSLEDITQILAVARPEGFLRNRFYDYTRQEKTLLRGFPAIEDILGKTNYTVIYQEQAMQVATRLAGLPQVAAERLKKMMSDGLSPEERETLISSIQTGLTERGFPEFVRNELISQISAFTGYGFVEGHSRALAKVSYDLGYYATHFPEFYWTSVMTTVAEKQTGLPYPPQTYVNEVLRKGIQFTFPDSESLRDLPYFQDGEIVVGKKLFTSKSPDIQNYNKLLYLLRNPATTPQERIWHQLYHFGTVFTENPIGMFPKATHYDPQKEQQWIVGQSQSWRKFKEQKFVTFDSGERLQLVLPIPLERNKPEAFKSNFWFVRISDDMTIIDAKPLHEANKLW